MAGRKKSKKIRVNFLIDRETYEKFSLVCEELGLVRSKNVEHHLARFLKEHQKLLKELKK